MNIEKELQEMSLLCDDIFAIEDDEGDLRRLSDTLADRLVFRPATKEQYANQHKKLPQIGDRYYFVEKDGDVNWYLYVDDKIDKQIRSFGNFFRTEEEAKEASKKLKEFYETIPR